MSKRPYQHLPPLEHRPDGSPYRYLYYPICEVVALLRCGRQKAVNTLRELCSMRGWWKSRNRAVENPTAFTQNPMRAVPIPDFLNFRFGTPEG